MNDDDDTDHVGWAGWMYADVLLALFVVVLAAVPLVGLSRDSGDDSTATTTTTTTLPSGQEAGTTLPPVELCEAVSIADAAVLEVNAGSATASADFQFLYAVAMAERGLDSPPLGFALAFGGPTIDEGTVRSRNLMERLAAELPSLMERSGWRALGDRSLNSSTVRIEVFPLTLAPCV